MSGRCFSERLLKVLPKLTASVSLPMIAEPRFLRRRSSVPSAISHGDCSNPLSRKTPYLDDTGRESPAVAGQKNSQLAPARRVAMKMGRRGEACRRFGVLAFRRIGTKTACRHSYNDQHVSTKLRTLFNRPHADSPIRPYVSPRRPF
jgi:hypothetical protein